MFAQESELVAFIFADLFAPGGFDGLDMRLVARFANQVALVWGIVLDHHDPFEVDPEVPGPFLYGFFAARVKPARPISRNRLTFLF